MNGSVSKSLRVARVFDFRLAASSHARKRAFQIGGYRPGVRGEHHQLPPVGEEFVHVDVVRVEARVEVEARVGRKPGNPGDGNRGASRRRVFVFRVFRVVAVARA